MSPQPLVRRLLAEMLGFALLAALVIGSGIAAQTLSPGDVGLQLLEVRRTFSPAPRALPTPAISVGRMFSNTFAGIAPASVPGFVMAQLAGGVVAILIVRVLYPDVTAAEAAEIVVPRAEEKAQAISPALTPPLA